MKWFFRFTAGCFVFAMVGAVCFMGCFCYKQNQKTDELEVLINAQRQKIIKLENKIKNNGVSDLASALEDVRKSNSSCRQELGEWIKKSEESVAEFQDVRLSVRNLANGMFGTYPCSDIQYLSTAISYKSLPDDIKDLRRQLLDIRRQLLDDQAKTDGGMKDTVEALSMCVFGEYPHTEVAMHTSLIIDGTLKDQVQKLKRKVESLEISMRFH